MSTEPMSLEDRWNRLRAKALRDQKRTDDTEQKPQLGLLEEREASE